MFLHFGTEFRHVDSCANVLKTNPSTLMKLNSFTDTVVDQKAKTIHRTYHRDISFLVSNPTQLLCTSLYRKDNARDEVNVARSNNDASFTSNHGHGTCQEMVPFHWRNWFMAWGGWRALPEVLMLNLGSKISQERMGLLRWKRHTSSTYSLTNFKTSEGVHDESK